MYVFELDITKLTEFGNGVMGDLGRDEELDEAHCLGAWGGYAINYDVKEGKK
jgi:hypothetical protein